MFAAICVIAITGNIATLIDDVAGSTWYCQESSAIQNDPQIERLIFSKDDSVEISFKSVIGKKHDKLLTGTYEVIGDEMTLRFKEGNEVVLKGKLQENKMKLKGKRGSQSITLDCRRRRS